MSIKALRSTGLFKTPNVHPHSIQHTIEDTLDIYNKTLETLYNTLGSTTLENLLASASTHRSTPSN